MERQAQTVVSLGAQCYSDSDEEDLRAEQLLLKDKWRTLFDQYDPEGFGEIPWPDFMVLLARGDFREEVSSEKVDMLLELAYRHSSTTSAITFQQFVNVMTGKRTQSFTCAVHCRDRLVHGHGDFHVAARAPQHLLGTLTSLVSREVLTDPRDRKYYSDMYRCWPPPWFILLVSLLQLTIFAFYCIRRGKPGVVHWPELGDSPRWNELSLDTVLAYCPTRKREMWRFLTYSLLHSSWWHLTFNLVVQAGLGVPLEMVHGSGRVATIYISGVLAGSLATSLLDPRVCLVGASGGVYSLLAAHLANLVLNFQAMQCGSLRLVALLAVASVEVGVAVYGRYATLSSPPVSYLAHISGSVAGVTIGLVVLKNFQQRLWERWVWWVALFAYSAFILAAFAANLLIID